MSEPATPWADKASALYDERYAQRYRAHDDGVRQVLHRSLLIRWQGTVGKHVLGERIEIECEARERFARGPSRPKRHRVTVH